MVFYVNGSVRHPVFDCDSGKYYGRITDILLDDGFKEVLGYVCRTRIFRPHWAFDISAVRLVNDRLMLIDRKGKKWLPLNKALNEARHISKKNSGIRVVEEGDSVGQVADFAFEPLTGEVLGILVSTGLISKLRFVPQSEIEMTGKESILVRKGSVTRQKPAPEERVLTGLPKYGRALGAAAKTLRKRLREG